MSEQGNDYEPPRQFVVDTSAAEISLETGVIVYYALFLALAEDADTVVITADGNLLKALEGTPQAYLAHPLSDAANLIPSTE